jgi:predicted ArsR family transcriptional regulator
VLSAVLLSVQEREGDQALESLLRDAGERLGRTVHSSSEDFAGRVAAMAEVIRELGGAVDEVPLESGIGFRGRCCPLASLSPRQPSLCKLLESMIASATGAEVEECCDRGSPPHCQFDIREQTEA